MQKSLVLTHAHRRPPPRPRRAVPAHAWTMTSALTQITVPEACVPTDPNRRQGEPAVCAELRREGGMRFVGIEEMLAGPVDGRLPTRANWSDITMNIFFNAWAQGVVRGAAAGRLRRPSSPRPACRGASRTASRSRSNARIPALACATAVSTVRSGPATRPRPSCSSPTSLPTSNHPRAIRSPRTLTAWQVKSCPHSACGDRSRSYS
jgi:hypothetical protein